MSRTKGQITIPWNFSGWFTTWKVPESCTLPSGEGNSCSLLLLPDLQMDQLCRVCCLTGHLNPECYEFTAMQVMETTGIPCQPGQRMWQSNWPALFRCACCADLWLSVWVPVRELPTFAHIYASAAHSDACSGLQHLHSCGRLVLSLQAHLE